jgi:hypothetical protein
MVDGFHYRSRRRRKLEEETRRRKRNRLPPPLQQLPRLKLDVGKKREKIVKTKMSEWNEKRKREGVTMRIWTKKMKDRNLGSSRSSRRRKKSLKQKKTIQTIQKSHYLVLVTTRCWQFRGILSTFTEVFSKLEIVNTHSTISSLSI